MNELYSNLCTHHHQKRIAIRADNDGDLAIGIWDSDSNKTGVNCGSSSWTKRGMFGMWPEEFHKFYLR